MIGVCVSDTEKPRMTVTALTQLPVPPNALCFFMRLLGIFVVVGRGWGRRGWLVFFFFKFESILFKFYF